MTKQKVTVSVIIPTYNSSGTLALALESVIRQDFTDFDVWVVGDGCTDNSENLVASLRDKRIHWLNLPSNSGGPSLPRNEGLRRAAGRYIAYLGHDDLWFPWHLSELVECIAASNADLVSSLGILLGPNGIVGTFSLPHRPRSPNDNLSPSNWLHRKALTEVIGSWSLRAKVGADREFSERLLAARAKLELRAQLSVLKFPAALWRMYSLRTAYPQAQYSKAMRRNPENLRLQLLLEVAKMMSQKGYLLYEHRSAVYRWLRELAASAMYAYGSHRWPVNTFIYGQWRKRTGLAQARRVDSTDSIKHSSGDCS